MTQVSVFNHYEGTNSAKAWSVKNLTSSDMRVAMDLPISWYLLWFPIGPSNINTNLVGTGTSVKSRRMIGCSSLTKVTTGWFRKSTSPTRMLAASAPGGIFFMKCRLCNIEDSFVIATLHVYKTGISYGWQLGFCPNWMFVMLSEKKPLHVLPTILPSLSDKHTIIHSWWTNPIQDSIHLLQVSN